MSTFKMLTTLDQEVLQAELKKKRICRFCLNQDGSKITNIYMRDTRIKSSAPLPIQIMAIASIEVFSNDGMPSFVCCDCTNMFEYSYQFKQMCKKADNLLRQFPLTGVWPACLDKPVFPMAPTTAKLAKTAQPRMQHNSKAPARVESLVMPKKILNSAHYKAANTTDAITPDIPPQSERSTKIITKIEKEDTDCTITFLEKIENNEELSIDDIQQLMAAEEIIEAEEELVEKVIAVEPAITPKKPKLLNKSSIRILNKDAEQGNEPRLSVPTIKKDVDGKTEIIAEILNEDDIYEGEPDPTNAVPIETNVFPCSECERSFPLLQLRDLHMKNHTRDRKFHCDNCEKSFFSKYDLHRHSFIHNGKKPFKCAVCEKAFSRSSLLTRHEKSHTDVPKYICVHCERAFISKDDLEKHSEKHNIIRPFKCKICNKGFAFKQGLERHEVVHSRQQPFSCQYCSESFSTTTKLSRHLTAHAGHRPYPCKFCRKSYLLSHHLTRHLRSHKNVEDPTNIISFTCMQCNQSFDSREKLIKHSPAHANEKNLSCPLCKDIFDSLTDLVSHIDEHSSGELYACEFCDLIFLSAEKLQMHTDSDHVNEMEAYHADDRAQADKQKEAIKDEQSDINVDDEGLQNSDNEFLPEEKLPEEKSNSQSSLLKNNLKSAEKQSPKIINQIIIQSPVKENKQEKVAEKGSSLLIPFKQRKLSLSGRKVATTESEPSQETKQSPQLRRKIPNASGSSVPDPSQPSVHSMFKLPKNVTVTKTSTANTLPTKAPSTRLLPVKIARGKTPPAKTTATKTSPSLLSDKSIKTEPKLIKVEKVSVGGSRNAPTNQTASITSSSKSSSGKMAVEKKLIKTDSVPTPKLVKVERDTVEEISPSTSAQADRRRGKIKKITVTKAQAAAMAKEGRIKIKDGKIILKK